jgi:hypothetical protein
MTRFSQRLTGSHRPWSFTSGSLLVAAAVAAYFGSRVRVPYLSCVDSRGAPQAKWGRAWEAAGARMHVALWLAAVAVVIPILGITLVRAPANWDREKLGLVSIGALISFGALYLLITHRLHRPPCEGL